MNNIHSDVNGKRDGVEAQSKPPRMRRVWFAVVERWLLKIEEVEEREELKKAAQRQRLALVTARHPRSVLRVLRLSVRTPEGLTFVAPRVGPGPRCDPSATSLRRVLNEHRHRTSAQGFLFIG